MSGANQAWHWFGYDFGNGNWFKDPGTFIKASLDSISENGGNSFRIWLHPSNGDTDANIPVFDENGYVTGTRV